ncbi:MAG: hypothetical protein M1838_002891 [Thelocarpon superellum]|nr:MAG: hypothetical protein M1838_002891 [Thelocarpon superellum]
MGSVVISDVVSDTTRFPYQMLARDPHHHPRQSSPGDPSYRPSTASPPSARSTSHPTPPTSLPSSTPVSARDPRVSGAVSSSHASRHTSPYTPPGLSASSTPSGSSGIIGASGVLPAPPGSVIRHSFPTQRHIGQPIHGVVAYMGQTPPFDPAVAYLPTSTSQSPAPSPSTGAIVDPPAGVHRRIKVQSLAHIQQLANENIIQTRPTPSVRSGRGSEEPGPKFEISEMPVADVIEMVAGLLTKITTTNDRQHEHLHRHIPPPEGTTGLSQQTSSVLAFHGKNVPSITILSYLSRIHKYCPTTYEVFLSLLVYFDRMTERVNSSPIDDSRPASQHSGRATNVRRESGGQVHDPDARRSSHSDRRPGSRPTSMSPREQVVETSGAFIVPEPAPRPESMDMSHFFVVDSFNIHRLVIAGVTCASKFFSDVFYTNSRYAKVGGLPLVELNHLEIQFLLLNDFRLLVPVEELEAYGTMLVEFYAREITAQQSTLPMEGVVVEAPTELQSPTPP